MIHRSITYLSTVALTAYSSIFGVPPTLETTGYGQQSAVGILDETTATTTTDNIRGIVPLLDVEDTEVLHQFDNDNDDRSMFSIILDDIHDGFFETTGAITDMVVAITPTVVVSNLISLQTTICNTVPATSRIATMIHCPQKTNFEIFMDTIRSSFNACITHSKAYVVPVVSSIKKYYMEWVTTAGEQKRQQGGMVMYTFLFFLFGLAVGISITWWKCNIAQMEQKEKAMKYQEKLRKALTTYINSKPQKEVAAATTIQKWFKNMKDREMQKKVSAATTIQKWFKNMKDREMKTLQSLDQQLTEDNFNDACRVLGIICLIGGRSDSADIDVDNMNAMVKKVCQTLHNALPTIAAPDAVPFLAERFDTSKDCILEYLTNIKAYRSMWSEQHAAEDRPASWNERAVLMLEKRTGALSKKKIKIAVRAMAKIIDLWKNSELFEGDKSQEFIDQNQKCLQNAADVLMVEIQKNTPTTGTATTGFGTTGTPVFGTKSGTGFMGTGTTTSSPVFGGEFASAPTQTRTGFGAAAVPNFGTGAPSGPIFGGRQAGTGFSAAATPNFGAGASSGPLFGGGTTTTGPTGRPLFGGGAATASVPAAAAPKFGSPFGS